MVMLAVLGWHGHPINERAVAQPAPALGVSK
jgi:hypothetical protein